MKFDREAFEGMPDEKKMGLIKLYLGLATHNGITKEEMEEGLCAGLRTNDGDGEPCETCKECRLQYQYDEMHEEEEG